MMTWAEHLATSPMVLLQIRMSGERAQRWKAVQTHFKEPDPTIYIHITIALAGIVGVFVLVKLLKYWQDRRAEGIQAQPWGLFKRVQSQLGLSWGDRWAMWRLARTLRLEHPTALLISAQFYDHAVQDFLNGRGGGRATRYSEIRGRLFAK